MTRPDATPLYATPEQLGLTPPVTREAVLRGVITKIATWDTQRMDYRLRRDPIAMQGIAQQRATLIAELPLALTGPNIIGPDLPEEAMGRIRGLAADASKMIDQDNYFGMVSLLSPQGSSVNEPNELEKLVDSVYPSP
jgi:hypothetical protein